LHTCLDRGIADRVLRHPLLDPGIAMNEASVCAAPSNYEALVDAIDARRKELALSHADLDRIAGVAAGYTGKVLGPSRTKKIGWLSTFDYLGALGLKIVLVADDEMAKRHAKRGLPRQAHQARPGHFAVAPSGRHIERVLRHMATCYSWREIMGAASQARATVAAEQATREAKDVKRPSPSPAA
jgi:hypothetical protein